MRQVATAGRANLRRLRATLSRDASGHASTQEPAQLALLVGIIANGHASIREPAQPAPLIGIIATGHTSTISGPPSLSGIFSAAAGHATMHEPLPLTGSTRAVAGFISVHKSSHTVRKSSHRVRKSSHRYGFKSSHAMRESSHRYGITHATDGGQACGFKLAVIRSSDRYAPQQPRISVTTRAATLRFISGGSFGTSNSEAYSFGASNSKAY